MSYRCSYCRANVPDGVKMLRHVQTKTVTPTTVVQTKHGPVEQPVGPPQVQVAAEHPVCLDCSRRLKAGVTPAQIERVESVLKTIAPAFTPTVVEPHPLD